MSTSRLPHLEQTSRSRQSSTGFPAAAPSSHLSGIGLDLTLAGLAPHDDADTGVSRAARLIGGPW
jgi:hypothetical protein